MKSIALVWFLGIVCPAADLRWQPIAVDRFEGEVYLDMESVHRTGDRVEFWESQRYKSPLMYSNLIYDQVDVHYEMTCGSHDVRPTAYIVKLHGAPLHNDVRNYGRMPMTSQAGVEIAFRKFCTDTLVPDPSEGARNPTESWNNGLLPPLPSQGRRQE